MSNLPRILPLVAIAVGGVMVVKTLAGAELLPDAIAGARAWAEEAPKAEKGKKAAAKAEAEVEADTAAEAKSGGAKDGSFEIAAATPGRPGGPASKPPGPAAVCAPSAADLAKDAGLSPAELQVLQSLGARRGQLDAREKEMDLQLKLLTAAEAKLDVKLRTMNTLKGQIEALIGEASKKEDTELDRLVTVYQKMKPREAAAVMTQLDDKVRVPVAAKMKEAALAAILAQMPPAEAKKLTELLAQRFQKARQQAAQLASPVAAAEPAPAETEEKAEAPAPKRPAARPAAKPRAQAKAKIPAPPAAAPAAAPATTPEAAPAAAAEPPKA
jgi:flagellar motility protein MotE (MotC chaperone)